MVVFLSFAIYNKFITDVKNSSKGGIGMRKHFLDNARYTIVITVIVYHVFYLFNSVGVIGNLKIQGIPQFDIVEYVLYPWMMTALFIISGAGARFALIKNKKNGKNLKDFMKSKCRHILLPSIVYIFAIGWMTGYLSDYYNDVFQGNGDSIPGIFKYLIYCLCGIGPSWFLRQLMVCFIVLVIVVKLDKNEKFYRLGKKTNLAVLLLMFVPMWLCAQIGTLPYIEVYRNGLYIFSFLLGYVVFSQEKTEGLLKKYFWLFAVIAVTAGTVYTIVNYGKNFAELSNLNSILTIVYTYFGVLAVISLMKKCFDKEYRFTRFMKIRSFSYYLLHYPVMALSAYAFDRYFHLAPVAMYLSVFAATAVLLPLVSLAIRKIPVIRTLLLGM